jgi:glycosyltransferase involved in cell wall biosynthesis
VGKRQVIESYAAQPELLHELPFVAPSCLDGEVAPYDGPIPLPEKFLFYPAQFWAHKNHHSLIRALAMLRSRIPDIKLVCAGAAKNGFPAVHRLVEELGLSDHVLFLGYVPERQMPALYLRARALVMPTFFGPTNIPPLEAMKIGCPAAVSNIYAMPEQTKGAALLFDPSSVEEIALAISRLWEDVDLCRTLVAKGLEVSNGWTTAHFAERLAVIIREVTA